jgi:pilus assembly protein Flp/PilA
MKNLFNRFVREESGQDLIEYSLLAALIALAAVAAIRLVGVEVDKIFDKIVTELTTVNA